MQQGTGLFGNRFFCSMLTWCVTHTCALVKLSINGAPTLATLAPSLCCGLSGRLSGIHSSTLQAMRQGQGACRHTHTQTTQHAQDPETDDTAGHTAAQAHVHLARCQSPCTQLLHTLNAWPVESWHHTGLSQQTVRSRAQTSKMARQNWPPTAYYTLAPRIISCELMSSL